MRVATLDIGTNTVLMLVADRRADGSLVAVDERATITRLGEGVDVARRLSPSAVRRTIACLEEYAHALGELRPDRVAVVGTSAMRDAGGGEDLLAYIRASLGVDARVVTGREEALLTFRGALGGLTIPGRTEFAVFDIGGGSTEIVFGSLDEAGQPLLKYSESFDIGSVRLTERLVAHDPPTHAEREALVAMASRAFASVPAQSSSHPPIAIAGTMTTLAAVALGLRSYDGAAVHGYRMARESLRRVVDELAEKNLESRRRVDGLQPKRADVIVAGGSIALALLDHWNADEIMISDRGVRWGLAEELASDPHAAFPYDSAARLADTRDGG